MIKEQPPTKSRVSIRQMQMPEEYTAASGIIHGRANIRLSDGFNATLMHLDLGRVRVRQGEASATITMVGAAPDCHAFTFATALAPQRVIYGRPVAPEALCHLRPNDLYLATGGPWPWASIGVDYEELEQCGRTLTGRDLPLSRSDMAIFTTPRPARERLLHLMQDARRLAALRPEVTSVPAASHSLSGTIVEALAACLAQAELSPDRAAARRRYQVMARLDRVLEEHAEEMLTLAQICAAVGVAERTLHLICQEFVGMGPTQYWRLLRLNLVRKALLAADPQTDRVSAIAMRYGFWALGRFALAYRATFGELPSRTLRRS